MINAIEIKNIKKKFKDLTAVDGISHTIKEGEYVALLGQNGAGKTTLVEMLEGIQFPDEGEIQILGMKWDSHENEIRKVMGFSLQETKFIDKLTVDETMKLFFSFYSSVSKKSDEILELVGLSIKKKSYVENLSGGQRQKLALAIALINNPRILILDEPTTGLDPGARREIWNILQELKKQSTTLILTTHYMEEAEQLCDRIVFLDKGQILASGTLSELLELNSLGEYVNFVLLKNDKTINWESIPGFRNIYWNEKDISGKIHVDDIISFLPLFLKIIKDNNLNLLSFECKKMTLDDLFLSMTGRSLGD